MADSNGKFSRRTIALFWCVAILVLLGSLIYFEQIAVLYVLTTLALVVLLLIVAFANLEKVGRENIESANKQGE